VVEFDLLVSKSDLLSSAVIALVGLITSVGCIWFVTNWETARIVDKNLKKSTSYYSLKMFLMGGGSVLLFGASVFVCGDKGFDYLKYDVEIREKEYRTLKLDRGDLSIDAQLLFKEQFNRFMLGDNKITRMEHEVLTDYILDVRLSIYDAENKKMKEDAILSMGTEP